MTKSARFTFRITMLAIVLLLCITAISTPAKAATYGQLTYEVVDGQVTITDCIDTVSGHITIPAEIGGYPVTAIADAAFCDCANLTGVTIPDSVTSIGFMSFGDCYNLTTVTLPDSVLTIHNHAFSGSDNLQFRNYNNGQYLGSKTNPYFALIYGYDMNNYAIHSNTKVIGGRAFTSCSSISSINIPSGVVAIGNQAFEECSNLTSVTIPSTVKVIDFGAFMNCESLSKITIPNSVTTMGDMVFYECYILKDVTLSSNLTAIGDYTFHRCYELATISIPNSVKKIGSYAFNGCTKLKTITLGSNVRTIGREAFAYCTGLTKVTIGKNITEIGDMAFSNCTGLTSITIPSTVNSIGYYAFEYCTGLTKLTIPEGVKVIGAGAFQGCSGVTSISIPSSIEYIGDAAFAGCNKVSFNYYNNGKYLGNTNNPYVLFVGRQNSPNGAFNLHKNTKVLYSGAFKGSGQMESITLPEGLKCIGDFAFFSNIQLKSIKLPDSLIYIGYQSFRGCSKLESISIPDSVIFIDSGAFWGCTNLTSVKLSKNIASIGQETFFDCIKLKSISLPNGVTSIGNWAFGECSALATVNLGSGLKTIGEHAFIRCSAIKSIHIPEGTTTISNFAFNGCSAMTDIYIPNTITQIGGNTFQDCSALVSIRIPEGVKKLNWEAFRDCTALKAIILPTSLTDVQYGVFNGCNALSSVYYGGSTSQWSIISISDHNDALKNAALTAYYAPPSFIVQPENKIVTANEKATFIVRLTEDVSVQWQYRSSSSGSWKNVSAASGKTLNYIFTAEGPNHGYEYRCKVTDSAGFVYYSKTAKLSVLAVATQPKNQYKEVGQTAKFTVSATGDGLKYQWLYRTSSSGSWKTLSATSSKTKTLSISATVARHGYQYRCKITDSTGSSIYTNAVSLYVLSIKTQPTSKTVKSGATAKFTVAATGKGLSYQWQYRTSSSGSWKNTSATGNKTATLSISATTAKHSYQYRCRIKDSAGNAVYTNAVTLYVFGIKTQPVSKTIKVGTTAKFTVSAVGRNLKFQWQYRTSSKASWKNTSSTSGKTKTLSVAATASKHGYQYRCKITDSAGNTVYSSIVNLYVLGIKTQPASKTVVAGKTAKFTVSAIGKSLKYQWQYRTSSNGSWKTTTATGSKTKTLSIAATTSKHGYQYRCKITDSAGNTVYSSIVNLYVLGIKTQPTSKTVKVGATAKFTVSAVGRNLKFQWQYRTSSKASWKNTSATGSKTKTLSVPGAKSRNGYQYRCRITDSSGNVIYSNIVKLTVK